jgi:non-canonical purine NTP pyrophosphatase (RdgB/HAM1 family)
MIYFITSNKNKIREAEEILGVKIEGVDLNLPEIQNTEVEKVVTEKIKAAKMANPEKKFILEDSALYLGEKKEVGALIKFFPNHRVVRAYKGEKAFAACCLGLWTGEMVTSYVEGKIVPPRGNNGFGWDEIFEPVGPNKTFAEMAAEEKNAISPRRNALDKLKEKITL